MSHSLMETDMYFAGASFGGWQQSDTGRLKPIDEWIECMESKTVNVAFEP